MIVAFLLASASALVRSASAMVLFASDLILRSVMRFNIIIFTNFTSFTKMIIPITIKAIVNNPDVIIGILSIICPFWW